MGYWIITETQHVSGWSQGHMFYINFNLSKTPYNFTLIMLPEVSFPDALRNLMSYEKSVHRTLRRTCYRVGCSTGDGSLEVVKILDSQRQCAGTLNALELTRWRSSLEAWSVCLWSGAKMKQQQRLFSSDMFMTHIFKNFLRMASSPSVSSLMRSPRMITSMPNSKQIFSSDISESSSMCLMLDILN